MTGHLMTSGVGLASRGEVVFTFRQFLVGLSRSFRPLSDFLRGILARESSVGHKEGAAADIIQKSIDDRGMHPPLTSML